LDIFFDWEYERDCPPNDDPGLDGTGAATRPGPILGDDNMTIMRGVVYAHEAGHHLAFTNVHFDHDAAQAQANWNLTDDLMRPGRFDDDIRITLRQAVLANTPRNP
jgi:hypothetical protein